MRATAWLLAMLGAIGCGSGGADGSGGLSGTVDLGAFDAAGDLTIPTACDPVDDQSDGQPCGSGNSCAAGTVAVELAGACRCYRRCNVDVECACDRVCDPLTSSDGGAAGGACLPGNGPGVRCGQDATTGALFGDGLCAQGLACIDADASHRYCAYDCTGAADCPAQTMCAPLSTGASACALVAGNEALGQPCVAGSDDCQTGQLCDGVCRAQCDGPDASCASGSCSALSDGSSGEISGYVCK